MSLYKRGGVNLHSVVALVNTSSFMVCYKFINPEMTKSWVSCNEPQLSDYENDVYHTAPAELHNYLMVHKYSKAISDTAS